MENCALEIDVSFGFPLPGFCVVRMLCDKVVNVDK